MNFNPFGAWGESTRRMHDLFVVELNGAPGAGKSPMTPCSAAFIGALLSLEMSCYRMGGQLRQLERHDPKAFDALVRAIGKSS